MKPHLLHRPGCIRLSLLALLILILTASCSGDTALSLYLEANRANLDSALALEARPTTFVVQPGSPAKLIGEELERGGIIGDSLLFEAFVRTNGLAHRLEAGTFTLSPDMTIPEIAEALQNAIAPESRWWCGPECGWRKRPTCWIGAVWSAARSIATARARPISAACLPRAGRTIPSSSSTPPARVWRATSFPIPTSSPPKTPARPICSRRNWMPSRAA